MHEVKRAIIMAAGIGARMQPVTLITPKPLVCVNGIRMIDTVIQSLKKNAIHEIYVVVGYKSEAFYSLPEQYPGVTLIENPYYDTCNNIASLYMARNFIEEAIILDGDQIIYNSNILSRRFERSGYNAIWVDAPTNEWLMQLKDGLVTSCSKVGGNRGWQLFSISRWTREDGRKLKSHLEQEFEQNQNRQIYWDDVVMFLHLEDYALGIREMSVNDVVEIDSYEELVRIDASYSEGVRNE